jgi:hypothetical protein
MIIVKEVWDLSIRSKKAQGRIVIVKVEVLTQQTKKLKILVRDNMLGKVIKVQKKLETYKDWVSKTVLMENLILKP